MQPSVSEHTDNASEQDPLDPNTTLDVYVGPNNSITELADTVDTMDGVRAETIDISNEEDGTHVEVILLEEPSPTDPNIDVVDNFVSVEGIGPEVASLLIAGGIRTFKQLANTPIERIRTILEAGGTHFRIHEAENWAERAGHLAATNPFGPEADLQLPYGFAQWPNEKTGGEATA